MLEKSLALELVKGKPWHHNFEIVPGVSTNGSYNPGSLWAQLQLPARLEGLSLADVGASNGFFSFEARKRGAKVVAFDFRHKDNSGFGLAQHINKMNDIEHHHVNVLKLSKDTFGEFDIVLCLGLLYHTSDPYLALANCGLLSRKQLFIESYCIDSSLSKELSKEPIMKFISDPLRFPKYATLNNDSSNFWGFTSECLKRMVEDIGFAVKKLDVKHDRVFIEAERKADSYNNTRLNLAYEVVNEVRAGDDKNVPENWIIF